MVLGVKIEMNVFLLLGSFLKHTAFKATRGRMPYAHVTVKLLSIQDSVPIFGSQLGDKLNSTGNSLLSICYLSVGGKTLIDQERLIEGFNAYVSCDKPLGVVSCCAQLVLCVYLYSPLSTASMQRPRESHGSLLTCLVCLC